MKRRAGLMAFYSGMVLMICSEAALATFRVAPEVPVERLLKNVAAYVKKNPKDPQGYYLLGRINALAFDRKVRKLRAMEKPLRGTAKLPWLDPWQGKLKHHLVDSIKNYRQALRAKPTALLAD